MALAVLSKSTDIDTTLACVSDIPTKDKPASIPIIFLSELFKMFLNLTKSFRFFLAFVSMYA